MTHWVLNADGLPVSVGDILIWAAWFKTADRRVAFDQLTADVSVSTVFLGLDHQWGDGPPILWETLVFGGPLDGEMDRYTSKQDALIGHREMCERVRLTRAATEPR